tara:strand:- start:3384 stop:4637 length:1254 start_codon:yes stop_codon:yes gene_type:complete
MQNVITETRLCRKCEYDLKGLSVGGTCPECGEPIRAARKFNARDGQMTDAPPRFVRAVILGFALMSAGILATVGGLAMALFGLSIGPLLLLAGAGAWPAGVWILSRPRPERFAEQENPVLDSEKFRLGVRVAAGLWAGSVLLIALGVLLEAGGMTGAAKATIVLGAIAGLGGLVGLVPISIFVAELEFWMSDDSGGWQLRGAAWCMMIFGVLGVVLALLMPLFAFMSALVVVGAALVLFRHIIGCTNQARWILRYQEQKEGQAERITERLRDRTERGGTVAGSTPCLECGYELRGLPYGGNCPECGTSYADRTPIPTRRPPTRRPEDDEPIAIDESDAPPKGFIRSRMPSFGKGAAAASAPEPPDDSPIPLSGDDPDTDDDMQAPPSPPEPAPPTTDDDAIPLADEDDTRPPPSERP